MDEVEEINDEGLDYDVLIENVRSILEEPEFKMVLKNIGISVDAILTEITNDMEKEDGGVEPSDNEKESSYSKKCVRAKVYQKLMEKYGSQLSAGGLEQAEIADDAKKELFINDFTKAMQSGNFSKMHKAVVNTGVLPVIDENGNEIYVILTPAQQKMFTKMIAENQRHMNAGIDNADLKDFDEYEEELDDLDNSEIDKNKKDANESPEINNEEKTSLTEPESELEFDVEPKSESGIEEDLEFKSEAGIEEDLEFESEAGIEEDLEFELDETFVEDDEKDFETITPKDIVTIDSLGHKRYDVKNTEYLEMHPEQRDATFVEAMPGIDIAEFARDLLLLKKSSEDKIVGVFNGIPLDTSKYNTVAEIQGIYNGEMQQGKEDKSIKTKGEFLEEGRFYHQFLKFSKDPNGKSEIEEYNNNSGQDVSEKEMAYSNICEPQEGVNIRDFLEAVKYMDNPNKVDMHGGKNYIKVHGILLCASEFATVDELAKKVEEIGKIQAYNQKIEEHPEKYPNAKKQEVFAHSKAYYQSKVVVDRKATNEQIENGNENAIVIKASKDGVSGFEEAARYFGARNPNILARGLRGEVFKPSEYESLEEMKAARIVLGKEKAEQQKKQIQEDIANGVTYERKNPFIFEKDLSEIQKQRWKIEHPSDVDAQLEDSRREMGFINKLTIQVAGMSLDDIVADVEDFKTKGFDVTVNLFGKVLDTRMCKDVKDIRGLVEETLHTGKSKQVADQRKEREVKVFESDSVGADIEKIDSVLADVTQINIGAQDNASNMMGIAKQMEKDGKELGIIEEKTSTKTMSQTEEQKDDDEHQFPEER